ncbi:Hsp33 family molecular chaperone HslO [Ponticaulis profundi]|uniref:Hsp33 family molecular chaperone HslO n=1 Tax=Ponticaulis profundi TaxID=2665222 RepID=A0ABW1SC13_9PROT
MVSGNLTGLADDLGADGNRVASFQLDKQAVRGRITRLDADVIGAILARHDYPQEAARFLGEALTLAVLVGAALKVDGRVAVQAQGEGPVSLMVAEYHTSGALRGMMNIDAEKWARLDRVNKGDLPHPRQVFGNGALAITVIQDNEYVQPYQGIVPLDGTTLAQCAEHYFMNSEQVPTRVRLAVGQIQKAGEAPAWQAGGSLIQRIAGDENRGDTEEDWNTASILFESVTDEELLDPDISMGRVLFRLFHENGVRMEAPTQIRDECTCSEERLLTTLKNMPDDELIDLAQETGKDYFEADCQFCGRKYDIPLKEVITSTEH